MITSTEITKIGAFIKPHGIKGELSAELHVDGLDITALRCIVMDIDGIYVPFFIDSTRPKSHNTTLILLNDIDDEAKAKDFAGKDFYALSSDLPETADDNDADGFYASDLIGYSVFDDSESALGIVSDYDDSTDNVVLMIKRPDDNIIYIPFVDDFFLDISPEHKSIRVSLPEGLTEL